MKIFVPHHRNMLPSQNSELLIDQLVEVDQRDLPLLIGMWQKMKELEDVSALQSRKLTASKICQYDTISHSLRPYLRRPHITVHCGAKDGALTLSKAAKELMHEVGRQVARHGFNFWYGGGNQGLMGAALEGFIEETQICRFDDQYSVQIIPAQFVYGVKSTNGNRPANEGLSTDTDIAIIFPEFVARRELLDNKSAATIGGPGGVGTLDENTDLTVHIKTGIRDSLNYLLNVLLPGMDVPYWQPYKNLIEHFVKAGYESAGTLSHMYFMDGVDDVFADLMPRLEAKGENPHMLYEANLREERKNVLISKPSLNSTLG